jgi:transposase
MLGREFCPAIPENLRATLKPLRQQGAALTASIRQSDGQIEIMAQKRYPHSGLLRQVKGVGALTAVAYLLTLEDAARFEKSREVGPYLGRVPRQDDSGDSSPPLGITKTGDPMLRRRLVGSAHYILGPFGEDCDRRGLGLKLAARGGKNAKQRAVVAVARKLAVLLHSLWVRGEGYEPLRNNASAKVARGRLGNPKLREAQKRRPD